MAPSEASNALQASECSELVPFQEACAAWDGAASPAPSAPYDRNLLARSWAPNPRCPAGRAASPPPATCAHGGHQHVPITGTHFCSPGWSSPACTWRAPGSTPR
eukprot:1514132-Pyramimonas_sp.AAC.1